MPAQEFAALLERDRMGAYLAQILDARARNSDQVLHDPVHDLVDD